MQKIKRNPLTLLASIALLLNSVYAYASVTFTTLVAFNGTNGTLPNCGLLLGKDGNFYGTTELGGAYMKYSDSGAGYGTLFKMTPSGEFTTLVNFGNGNGLEPCGNLIQDNAGNFYGTTLQGGEIGDGTVFKMSPDGKITVLHSFGADDENGWAPCALVSSLDGNFYGISGDYKYNGGGTVFKITPAGKTSPMAVFSGRNNPRPSGDLLIGEDGNLYGVLNANDVTKSGVLFKVTPNGKLTTEFSFNETSSTLQASAVIQGKDGRFFGITTCGKKGGAILKMQNKGGFDMLAQIRSTDKNFNCPSGELIEGKDGNFYGTTFTGNTNGSPFGYGTIFRLNPDGTMTTLLAFNGHNGSSPSDLLVQTKDGSLYGITTGAFEKSGGTIFKLSLEK